jgi:hypothetical protein
MKKIIIAIIISVSLFSCQDYIDDAFKNPNATTQIKPSEALPPIIANMARGIQWDSRFLGRYVQYWALVGSGGSWDRLGYDPNSDNGGEKWRTHYWNLGLNVINMQRDGLAEGKPEYAGAGHAIMAWSWLHLADYHGQVIFKEAFNTSALTFKFDDQDEVYKAIPAICDSALFYLNTAIQKGGASEDFKVADFYFLKGDLTKWVKFTNAVKAKVLHRYYNKSTYKPDDVIKAVDASLSSANDDVMIGFENGPVESTQANFYGPRRNNLPSYRPTDLVMRYFDTVLTKAAVDPRRAYIFKPSTDGKFRGLRANGGESTAVPANQKTNNFFGFANTTAATSDDNARTYFKNTSPLPILTYAEMQFTKAEAAFKKGDLATALTAFRNGIKGNIDMLQNSFTGYVPMTQAQIDAYLNAAVPKNASDLTLSQIMIQKYIALWGWGFEETWVDMRRYKYSPDVYKTFEQPATIYPDNFNKPVYRVRPRFNSEYLWNVEELKKIGALAPDYHTVETWFVNP